MPSLTKTITAILAITHLTYALPVTTGDDPQTPLVPVCDCSGTLNGANHTFVCGDWRLGPAHQPTSPAVASLLSHYDRFAGLEPGAFLARWTNATDPGHGFLWPEQDGWLLDDGNNPIRGLKTLEPGTKLDRFGGPGGFFLGSADAPFAQRALPPSSLTGNNYHLYQVLRNLTLPAGPIRPWFGQPGMGTQFYTKCIGNISELIDYGYLVELDQNKIPVAGGCD